MANWTMPGNAIRFVSALLLALPCAAAGQDSTPVPALDDLIPQEAVAAADTWAMEGANDQVEPGDSGQEPQAPFEALDIPEPDLGEFEADAGEGTDEAPQNQAEELFAEVQELNLPPPPELRWTTINDELELAFPVSADAFPERDAFIARFKQLREEQQIGNGQENVALRAARVRADRELLISQLRTYGYYDARVPRSYQLASGVDGAEEEIPAARFAILPGPQYRFGLIDLGQIEIAPDADELREVFSIRHGDPLLADRVVDRRGALEIALGEAGYPFARIDPPQLLIDHARGEGDLSLPVEPGGKYTFGGITSNRPEFLSAKHLSRIARFKTGDVYQRSLETDLRQAVLATGLVSSVEINPQVISEPAAGEPGVLRMDMEIEEGRLRTIAGAMGYGTGNGLKIEASWEHRNFIPPEGAIKVRGILGTKDRLVGVGFKRNNFLGRDQILTIDAYASDIRTEAVEAQTIGLRGAFERFSNLIFQKPFSWQIGAEFLFSDERNRVIGGVPRLREQYQVASLFGRATMDTTDSLLDPKRGYRASIFLAPEISRSFGNEVIYARGQADASFYLPASNGLTLAARARFATIRGARTFEVAPSRRIYAGGGSSVRGYAYQTVGPRNDFGEPTGGRSLVELSAEARIGTGLFDGAVQIVPFFDMGTVSLDPTPDFRFVNYGVGAGIRYDSGFGPIRLDVGVPLNRNPLFDSPVAVYISLGQAF